MKLLVKQFFLLRPRSDIQIFSYASCSQTPSINVLLVQSEAEEMWTPVVTMSSQHRMSRQISSLQLRMVQNQRVR